MDEIIMNNFLNYKQMPIEILLLCLLGIVIIITVISLTFVKKAKAKK